MTLSFLSFAEGFESEELSALELVELYVIEAVVVLAFAYIVYRLTLFFVEERLPESLDALAEETEDDESRPE